MPSSDPKLLPAISPKSQPSKAEPEEMDDKELQKFNQALTRYRTAWEVERDQRSEALDDLQFTHVENCQWDEYTRNLRKDRPKYEINKVALSVNQVLGDMRQSQVSGKVRPVSSDATVGMAKTFNGIIRSIENDSNFTYTKNIAAKEAFTGGFGAWQVITEYATDDSVEQNIKIVPIHSATTSVFFDPASKDECHRDARFAFVLSDISHDEYEELYGKDTPKSSLETEEQVSQKDYQERKSVSVADYWVKEPFRKRLGYFSDGKTREIDEELEQVLDEMSEAGVTLVRERTVDTHKVFHYKMSGDRFLDGPNEWAGKHIPVVPIYGYEMWLNNQHYYRGMVRFAKDAQRIYNYTTSAKIEASARAPQDPWLVTPRHLKGFEQQWQNFPNTNDFALPYNPDPMVPGGLPSRQGAPAVNNALVEQTYQADQDLQATTGRFAPSLGNNPREQSGKALGLQKQQGDLGTFELMDNLGRSVKRTTEILLDLIPKIIDTPRQERILNEDGTSETVFLNQNIVDEETGDVILVENDLSVGRYDVVSDIGPSYQTKRTEAVDALSFLIQTNPELSGITIDLLAKSLDAEFSEELEKRVRKQMIQNGQIEPNEEEMEEIKRKQSSPEYQKRQQMAMALEELQFKAAEAETRGKAADAYLKEVDAQRQSKVVSLEIEQAAADIDKTESETAKNMATVKDTLNPISSPQR